MPRTRLTDSCHAARLSLRERRARADESQALERVGETLARSPDVAETDTLRDFLAVIREGDRRIEAFELALVESLDADRADYVTVSRWTKPVVIVRGLCVRHVQRRQIARVRKDLRPYFEALGKQALVDANASRHVSVQLQDRIEQARALAANACNERAQKLQAYDGAPLPAWAGSVANEGRQFGVSLVQQTRNQVFPKIPAVAGLVTGWWVAQTFTDSRWKGLLHSIGIGDGGRRVVSEDTMQSLSFWLPILSAAFFAYLGDRIALAIRIHYQPRPAAAGAVSTPAPEPAANKNVPSKRDGFVKAPTSERVPVGSARGGDNPG